MILFLLMGIGGLVAITTAITLSIREYCALWSAGRRHEFEALERQVLGSWSEMPEPFDKAIARLGRKHEYLEDYFGATTARSNFGQIMSNPFSP